jgi:hypothetical protein
MEPEKFHAAEITFEYMEYRYPQYSQLYPPYDPYVSILDLLFMKGKDTCLYFEMLKEIPHESG